MRYLGHRFAVASLSPRAPGIMFRVSRHNLQLSEAQEIWPPPPTVGRGTSLAGFFSSYAQGEPGLRRRSEDSRRPDGGERGESRIPRRSRAASLARDATQSRAWQPDSCPEEEVVEPDREGEENPGDPPPAPRPDEAVHWAVRAVVGSGDVRRLQEGGFGRPVAGVAGAPLLGHSLSPVHDDLRIARDKGGSVQLPGALPDETRTGWDGNVRGARRFPSSQEAPRRARARDAEEAFSLQPVISGARHHAIQRRPLQAVSVDDS